jgi:hypothetical protein
MTRFIHAMLIAIACMAALVGLESGQAQAQKGGGKGEIPTVSIRFRNETKMAVIVQGASIVNGMQRRGQPIVVPAGKHNFDNNVPAGVRYVTVGDFNQASRILLRDFGIQVQPGRDLAVVIRPAPNNPDRVILQPDQQ